MTISTSFIHSLVRDKCSGSPQGAEGYDPISLFKAQPLIYLREVSSDRKLASALRYNARLCLLRGFNFPVCMISRSVGPAIIIQVAKHAIIEYGLFENSCKAGLA